MRKANGIENYATSGEYISQPYNWRKEKGVAPHYLWRSKEGIGHKRAILICQRKRDHWAVNESAINLVYKAEAERKTIDKGYVVLLDPDGKVVTSCTISEVYKATSRHNANQGSGEYGSYFYIDEELNVVAPGAFKVNDDI